MAAAAVDAYIGLGSNLGDRIATLDAAIAEIAALPGTSLVARSSFYESAPVDAGGDDYLNAVVHVATELAPTEFLKALQAIEAKHGRQRPYTHAPRTLDLDLLFHGSAVIDTPELTLPHPRLRERAFVLRPLLEVAAEAPGHAEWAASLGALGDQRIAKLDR